jgi:hypothetical protein
LLGKPEGRRQLGRPEHRWEANIRMDIREVGWEIVDWMHMSQERDQWQALMNMVMNLGSVEDGEFPQSSMCCS